MTVYAVGDIQGCHDELQALLTKVAFNAEKDELWCVGDLVNRGPKSLETLLFLYEMHHCVKLVLGNHDLHLIACFYDHDRLKKHDTIQDIIHSKQGTTLINWLRQQPLVYYDPVRCIAMVHAGIPPLWTLEDSLMRSAEVEKALQSDKEISKFLKNMYSNDAVNWHESLKGQERLRVITNYLTRMRFCKLDGTIEFNSKEGVDSAPSGYMPWFEVPHRKMEGQDILFGHWAALEGHCNEPHVYALDTGCVWGGCLTMIDVETKQIYSTNCTSIKEK